jgi:hypothetical protein
MYPGEDMNQYTTLTREMRLAKSLFGSLPRPAATALKKLVMEHDFSVAAGDLTFFGKGWYVTHTGLLRLAQRRRCCGIHTRPLLQSSDPAKCRWVFRATVFKSQSCKGFIGYGDAEPSNVSTLVHGAELRVAETRAVNRALRKAYGIGICSVEELGSSRAVHSDRFEKKPPAQSASANGWNGGPKVRDRLCQLIRQYQLDGTLVKAYAVEFCGTKSLRDATREQVENFVRHLAERAEKDRDALLCQLNSYLGPKEDAA